MSEDPTRPSSNKLAGVFFFAGALVGGGADHVISAANTVEAEASYTAETVGPAIDPVVLPLIKAEASYSPEGP